MAFDRSAEGHREIRSQRSAVSGAVGRGRIKLTGSPTRGPSFVRRRRLLSNGTRRFAGSWVGRSKKGGSEICQCRTKLREDRERERQKGRRPGQRRSARRPRRRINISPIN